MSEERSDDALIPKLLAWTVASCVALNLLGFALDLAWLREAYGGDVSYFGHKLENLGKIPFWLLSTLVLICANGVAIIKVYYNKMNGLFDKRNTSPYFPLLGANLIVIPLLLIAFVFTLSGHQADEARAKEKVAALAEKDAKKADKPAADKDDKNGGK
jgi:hypothetical protein